MTSFERLQIVIARSIDVKPEMLGADAVLEDLGIDSLGMIEVMFDLEDEFDIRIPSAQVQLKTLRDLGVYLDCLIASSAADAQAGKGREGVAET